MKKNDFHDKAHRYAIKGFAAGIAVLCAVTLSFVLSTKAHASQDAPDDLYAMQCVDGKCYYATGKEVPKDVLVKFQQYMTEAMAKLEKEEEGEESAE
jgi:hypothetical protein